MNSNIQASTVAKKNASAAIKRILYAALDEDTLDLEEKVESITQNLLNEGPHTLESEKAYFANFDETHFKIFTNKAYQEYLKERLSVANQAQSVNGQSVNSAIDDSFIRIGSVPAKQVVEEQPRRVADLKDIPIDAESVQIRPQDIIKKEEKKEVEVVVQRRLEELKSIPIDAESVQFRPQDLIKKAEEKKEVEVVVQRKLEDIHYIPVDSTSVLVKPQDIIKKEEVSIKFCEQNGLRDSIQYAPAPQNEMSKDVEEQLRMTARPLDNQQPRKEEEIPERPVVAQREEVEVKEEVPAARQFIQEEDIPVNNALLAETFQRLKGQAEKYDENFTLTLDLSSIENLKKESLMLPIVQQHKESDFATLFTAFRPLLFDLLKRREGFEDFTQTLRNLAKREKIASQNIVKQLEVKDILLLLVESCSQASLPQLGLLFSYQFYPLPLISLLGQKDYHSNLDCCLEYLFQVRKPLITNAGTKSAIGLGKSAFLSYLFSIKNPTYFSTKNGFTHLGAVDLYVNLPSDQQNYIVADVQSYREDNEFMNMLSGVLIASQIILVHITEKDISPQDGHINLNFKVNNKKSKVIYLWRDYDDDENSDLLAKAEKSIEKSEYELAIIGIPKLNAEQSFDVQNDKFEAMQIIFGKIKAVRMENCTPIVDLFKTFKLEEGFNKRVKDIPKNTDFDKEIKEVEGLLNVESKKVPGQSFTKSLLPCLWQDYRIIEERKKKKVLLKQHLEEMSEDEAREQEAKYNEIQEIIEDCKKQKSEVQAGKLIQKVMEVISSNELYRILLLSEVINNWKMPQFEEIRKRYIALSARKDGNNISEEQKKALVQEMDDKDLSLSTFLDEVLSFYETKSKSARNLDEYEGIRKYLLSSMLQGAPLNLVNGKTLKFGNGLFEEIFAKEIEDMKNIFVISIIGAQSSAKSTLLNVLFGCGFSTSAGRCTKGIYISLLHHPSGFKIIVIDTEGLLSVVARDHEFDNLITTMAFSCSHVVIINNKGEINAKLRDLLEICVYAMKHLKLTTIKPKIIFALRDIADNSSQTQQEMLLAMKSSLEQAAHKLSININHIIDFCQQDIFLLPSAFQLVQGDNKTSVQINNNLFSSRILEMRQYIFKYFASIKENSIPNPRFFYIQTQQLWNNISELGSDIMRAKNFLEIELKDEALDKVNTICQVHNETLLASGQKLVEYHKAELKKLDFNSTAAFFQVLAGEFNRIKAIANTELDNKIFRNEKYAIISGYFNEFREIVEYNLRWQKQRFVSDWNASILSWETDKEIKKFKTEIKQKVNEKIKNVSLDNLTAEIITYFEDLTHKLQIEFDKNMDRLRANITNNLPGEIHTHFDRASQIANRDKTKDRVLIPALSQVLDRIKGHTPGAYEPKLFYKHQIKWGRGDADKSVIMSEFRSFVGNLHLIITGESSDETALNVIHDCFARIRKLENEEVSVNRATFVYYGMIEAMYQQYNRAFEVETNKIQQKQKEFENVIEKEEQHIRDLLEDSSNSLAQGVRCAKHWFKEIKAAFCADQEMLIQQAVMKKIREEFPEPESANKKAYGLSFSIRNFENCLKYILNINKFIQEIYEERMKILSETEIEKNLELQAETFMSLIKRTIQSVREWGGDQNEHSNQIELGTLINYIDKNEGLKRYFPDLYAITLGDVKTFTRGCIDELSKEIQKNTLKEDLKAIIAKKIDEYLKGQYQILTGCQERCPMCHNKCTKADPVHRDHQTNCHLLSAFSGSSNRKTQELLLQCCFDPKHYQSTWFIGEKKFKSYDEMIEKEFPTWRQAFPRKEQQEKLIADIPPELMECWVGTKDVLTRYYGRKENTPKTWLDQVEPSKRLKANTFLIGYMEREKVNDL